MPVASIFMEASLEAALREVPEKEEVEKAAAEPITRAATESFILVFPFPQTSKYARARKIYGGHGSQFE